MNYEYLLFSRSKNEDYRWMVTPSYISLKELALLREIADIHQQLKFRNTSNLNSLYCLNLSSATVVFKLGNTSLTDTSTHPFFSLQGISVEQKFQKSLAFAISYLVKNHIRTLDVWRNIDPQTADKMSANHLHHNVLELAAVESEICEIARQSADKTVFQQANNQIETAPFNDLGLDKLVSWLSHSSIGLRAFAFGTVDKVLHLYPEFSFIARLTEPEPRDSASVVPQKDPPSHTTVIPSASATFPKEVSYEFCEITLEELPRSILEILSPPRYRFIAIQNKDDDIVRIAESQPFNRPNSQKDKASIERIHADLLERLVVVKWQPLPEKGEKWYSVHLRKRSAYTP